MLFDLSARVVEKVRDVSSLPVMKISPPRIKLGEAVVLHKTAPLRLRTLRRFDRHSNYQELLNVVGALRNLGFAVTVVDRSCQPNELPKQRFDVVFGLAAGNSGRLLPDLYERSPGAVKIAYCAGPEPRWSNNAIRLRYRHAYASRARLPPEQMMRTIDVEVTDQTISISDALVVHGNQHTIKTYTDVWPEKPIFRLSGIALGSSSSFLRKSGFERKFLAVGGGGAIVKGVDLLVDAAKAFPDTKFGYCGELDSDFNDLVGRETALLKNWSEYGFVVAKSKRFAEIASSHTFGILPSCSEGMATSVLTMMAHGLIPVVTEECGVDIGNFGFQIPVNRPLEDTVRMLKDLPDRQVEDRRAKSFAAGSTYTAEAHRNSLVEILGEIVGD